MDAASTSTAATLSAASSPASSFNMLEFFHTIEKLKDGDDGLSVAWRRARHFKVLQACFVKPGEPSNTALLWCRVMMLALVHDMAEADVGDITPEHVSGVTKEDKLVLEEKAMERISGLLGHPSIPSLRIQSLWHEYEDRKTPESKVTKDLDLFELGVQGVEYENSQNIRTLQQFFETTVPRIQHPLIKGWAHELMQKRREAWAQRGWNDYVHVDVAPEPTANGGAPSSRAAPIPQTVYGEHPVA
ncbi:5'-deoxynucleotidase, partial [Phenoliferia sp. Uapishka_3]